MPHEPKSTMLRCLKEEREPLSLTRFAEKLASQGLSIPPRTLRRWLAEMIRDGLVVKQGLRKSVLYQALQYQGGEGFSEESRIAVAQVRRPLFDRMPVAYSEDWFDAYEPNVSRYLPAAVTQQLLDAGQRLRKQDPAGTYAHQIFERLLIDLCYNSSRLEGNTYSRADTERFLLGGKAAPGKTEKEKAMILNHGEAIRYLVDNALRLDVTAETIYTLHYLLADGLVEYHLAGRVRDHGVRVGGSTYIPFEEPARLQLQLDRIVDKARPIKDPYEQSMFLLVQITYLQAFADVNKRTARLCANIPLIAQNLVPLSFIDVDRSDYNAAVIAIYELQDTGPLADLYVHSYLRTCALYDATVESLGFDEVRVRYRTQRKECLRTILDEQLGREETKTYLERTVDKLVPENVQDAFTKSVLDDLEVMHIPRLAGLGITREQMLQWGRRYHGRELI